MTKHMNDRILELLEVLMITPAEFAEQLGIERSTLSHIKTGRSKPSLDLVIKVLAKYPQISPDWLILGKQPVLRTTNTDTKEKTLFDLDTLKSENEYANSNNSSIKSSENAINETNLSSIHEKSIKQTINQTEKLQEKNVSQTKRIKRIIILYSDDTFEELNKD